MMTKYGQSLIYDIFNLAVYLICVILLQVMGGDPPKPKQPQKTLKEVITENVKEINKMRRQFQRETYKLQMNDKKMNKELKKLIEKKQPLNNKKTLAQNILKNQKMIAKYKSMDAQLQNTIFELQQMGTMQQMQNVMNGMAKIMGDTKNKFKMEQFQKSMKTYATQKQRMQIINEMVQDGMDMDDQIDDQAVNNLVRDKENQITHKKMMENANEGEQNIQEDI